MKLPTIKQKQSGFTLVELLVVIAVIAVLISIGLASYSRAQQSARDNQRRADLKQIAGALEQYYGDYSAYPSGDIDAVAGALEGNNLNNNVYLRQVTTLDPSDTKYVYTGGGQAYCLGSEKMETVPNNQTCGINNDYGYVLTPQD